MKYLIKSNLLVIVSAFAFPFIYFTITFKEYSYTQALMIIIAIFEAILVKSNYDFINYDHDFKYHIHHLKYLILISLLFSNGYHIIFNKSKYTLPLLSISINAPLCIVGYSSVYFIILGISIIYSIALAYYLSHLKTKVYTYDNY